MNKLLTSLSILLFASYSYANNTNHISDNIKYGLLTEEEEVAVKSWVSNALKDGDSAKFKLGDKVISINGEPEPVYCGLVNAKNSYGAYSGWVIFKSFVARNAYGKIIAPVEIGIKHGDDPAMQIGDGKIFEKVLFDMCLEKGFFKGNYLNKELIGEKKN